MGTGLHNAQLENSKQTGLVRVGDKCTGGGLETIRKGRGFPGGLIQSHFTDEKMESQRGEAIYPKSHS